MLISRWFLFFFLTTILYGSDDSSTTRLTLEHFIDATLQNHPTIKASRQIIKSAEAGVEGAKWNYFPTPSIELSQASGRTGSTLRLDQPLWNGGKIDAAYDIALLQKSESELILQESAYTLIETLMQSLLSYHQSLGSIQALEEGKEQLKALQSMLERRIEAGVSSQADRELILSRMSGIQADLDSARTKHDMARRQIELLSGEPINNALLFDARIIDGQTKEELNLSEDIRTTHPSLKKLSVRTQIAHSERDRAKSVVWPNVSLRAEHVSGSVYSDGSDSNSLVYLTAQMSPGAGLSALSSIQSAESKILQSQFERQSKERELFDAALRDYSTYRTSHERISAMKQTILSAQNVFDSYTRLFIAGKRQWLDLVNASREVTQYKTSLADLNASFAISAYQLALKRGALNLSIGEHP